MTELGEQLATARAFNRVNLLLAKHVFCAARGDMSRDNVAGRAGTLMSHVLSNHASWSANCGTAPCFDHLWRGTGIVQIL